MDNLINKLQSGLKIWIYSGDVDSNVPITGTITWIKKLKKEEKLKETEKWRAWFVPGFREHEMQVGGFTWELEKIRFVSVRGAGKLF